MIGCAGLLQFSKPRTFSGKCIRSRFLPCIGKKFTIHIKNHVPIQPRGVFAAGKVTPGDTIQVQYHENNRHFERLHPVYQCGFCPLSSLATQAAKIRKPYVSLLLSVPSPKGSFSKRELIRCWHFHDPENAELASSIAAGQDRASAGSAENPGQHQLAVL